mmetsp:Transcript_22771/g.50813  ORF Transcript_22771/g.50813 Transcript_22771/m.50813 type:complete len:109 (+) Transcript_22771:1611-1937(+)
MRGIVSVTTNTTKRPDAPTIAPFRKSTTNSSSPDSTPNPSILVLRPEHYRPDMPPNGSIPFRPESHQPSAPPYHHSMLQPDQRVSTPVIAPPQLPAHRFEIRLYKYQI